MADIIPPTPVDQPQTSFEWVDWYEKLRKIVNETEFFHNSLQGLQGGSSAERYHLTNTEHQEVLDLVAGAYQLPVGTIHISVDPTNPATTFGYGTWVAFGTGRVLVGVDTGDTDFDTVEETGGSK